MAIKGQSSRKDVKIEKRSIKNISVYLKDVDYNFFMEELDKVNEEFKKNHNNSPFAVMTVSLGQLIKARALNYNHICECHKLDKQVI
jgi:alpha-beta hydrolase superfamily lysophospholipase